MVQIEDIDFKKLHADNSGVFVEMLGEEAARVVVPSDANDATREAMVDEVLARARRRYAEYMRPKLESAKAERKAKAEAEEAERKQKIAEAWANWERLDDARTVALQALEDAFKAAVIASSQAAIAYPADRSVLPKRYSTAPEKVEGCGALAKSQSEMIRRLRDQVAAP